MTRSTNKETEVASPAPGRRSLRNRPAEDEPKKKDPPLKGKKAIGKKKEENHASNEGRDLDMTLSLTEDKLEGADELQTGNAEASSAKSSPSKTLRTGKKRQASEADEENDTVEGVKDQEQNSNLKNGDGESSGRKKAKKKRKPPVKKKKEEEKEDESEMWTPLEPLDGEEKREMQKKPLSKSDRRKQALVEREAAAEVMLQRPLPRQRTNSESSECLVVHSVSKFRPISKSIETVEIDDEISETGSIQIVAEPDTDAVFDFKRMLIQHRSVNLPSSLWGFHRDPRDQFVSFTRFNPDYPDNKGVMVDRTVVFNGTLHPEVFINNKKIELPEMFNVVETLLETSQVLQFANNTVNDIGPNEANEDK